MLKFIELMSTDHGKLLKQLSVFIEKPFSVEKKLYSHGISVAGLPLVYFTFFYMYLLF